MVVDLILLELRGLDTILGMDWLATNNAFMDCFNKEVTFRRPWFLEVVFYGEQRIPPFLISAMVAHCML